MKLWDKGYQLDHIVESFMTGDDPQLDKALIIYDCQGSIAHAKMLAKIGILSTAECEQLTAALMEIIDLAQKDQFDIPFDAEDVHTAVENVLTHKLSDLGKKLHTARSRNDQVLVDLRLFIKDQLMIISHATLNFCQTLHDFALKHQYVPMPGRTHFQRAMPSSMGLWAGAFAESMLDNIILLKTALTIIDQCPLGSAASYGVSLPIDRQYTADLLGFSKVQNNVLYANNSRGKFESIVLSAFVQIMNDLSKIATDIILFCAPEFGYFILPEKFCPGSSLMPQKRNPCPLELIRAKSATMQSLFFQILEITRALPSGYNRDYQETKRPLMQGCELMRATLAVFALILTDLQVDETRCLAAFTPELFATDEVFKLVQADIPFRDAYKQIGYNLDNVTAHCPKTNIMAKTHQGATGNLGLEQILQAIKQHKADFLNIKTNNTVF